LAEFAAAALAADSGAEVAAVESEAADSEDLFAAVCLQVAALCLDVVALFLGVCLHVALVCLDVVREAV
jgi:hypothetical protein